MVDKVAVIHLGAIEVPTPLMLLIDDEIRRARAAFPGNKTNMLALGEEYGELCKACLEETPEDVFAEAVQVVVMALRVITEGDSLVDQVRVARGLKPISPNEKQT